MTARPNPRKRGDSALTFRPIPFEDAELVEQVKGGAREAYAGLVQKYQDRVFNACWRVCGNLEDARDLTQEAFLKGLEGISGFRQESAFYTWIFRIAMNLALSHRRQASRRRTVSLDRNDAAGGTQAAALAAEAKGEAGDDPVSAASRGELQREVGRALQDLDEDHRAVVVLRDIEGFDYREIATILDVPTGTVKSRLFRARMALREAMVSALGRAKE